uniref:Mce/MlaD domain-containing protein n=1 Tax=Kapraunia schneideri TaxID=717899 RepID=A0A1Z1MSL4_9FLOR|nr:hypothetical protein [Kapraunia schneideri]ARW68869.1 hypothetical protein [Kapraunia schneideri]
MLNFRNLYNIRQKVSYIFVISIFFTISLIFSFIKPTSKAYFLFLEFEDTYGLKEGTPVQYKGVNIGKVTRVSLHVNKVIVLLTIRSSSILIPRDTLFEANQIGLFNDIVVSIRPICDLLYRNVSYDYLCKTFFPTSPFIPHNSYIKAYKGISYDDLIRSTTRISQRFDDPRFFSLFYLFLKNSLYISDEILILMYNSSLICQVFTRMVISALYQYIF